MVHIITTIFESRKSNKSICCIELLITICRETEVGVVGLLRLVGVVDLEFGVVGLLDKEPVRKRENLRGEIDLFSDS